MKQGRITLKKNDYEKDDSELITISQVKALDGRIFKLPKSVTVKKSFLKDRQLLGLLLLESLCEEVTETEEAKEDENI